MRLVIGPGKIAAGDQWNAKSLEKSGSNNHLSHGLDRRDVRAVYLRDGLLPCKVRAQDRNIGKCYRMHRGKAGELLHKLPAIAVSDGALIAWGKRAEVEFCNGDLVKSGIERFEALQALQKKSCDLHKTNEIATCEIIRALPKRPVL